MPQFKKAEDVQVFARIGIFAVSGSGKTVGALRIAQGLGGTVAIIDSEKGSSAKAKKIPEVKVPYDIWTLDGTKIEDYIAAINAAAKAGYQVLIIDSATHAWKELNAEMNAAAAASTSHNTWAPWAKGTPRHKRFVDAIINYPGHVICTMRTKTEWLITPGADGKNKPQRIGLSPEQGKGIEYEFDMLISIDTDHVALVEKDRTGRYQDQTIERIDESLGRDLAEWLGKGKPMAMMTEDQEKQIADLIERSGFTPEQVKNAIEARGIADIKLATAETADNIISSLSAVVRKRQQEFEEQKDSM